MHPEMHLVLYRQQEQELEARLARALVLRERGVDVRPARLDVHAAWDRLAATVRALPRRSNVRFAPADTWRTAPACCPA